LCTPPEKSLRDLANQDATMPRKKPRMLSITACGLFTLIFSGSLYAQPEDSKLEPVPGPPPLPSVKSGETLEPDITIIQGEKKTFHEYRINGRLYAVKVIPKNGTAYYMIDVDGDGTLETRENFLLPVPQWVLFSW